MSSCPACHVENPAGSKFCAGCGAPLPKMPVNVHCAACGAESPEGSRFCKGCGRPLAASVATGGPPQGGGVVGGGGSGRVIAAWPKAGGDVLQRIQMLLGSGAAVYLIGIFLMWSEIAKVKQMYGPYAGQLPGMGFQWLLIIVNAVLTAGNLYAITLAAKKDLRYAKWLFGAMIGLGGIFFFKNLSGSVVFILLNAALVVAGLAGIRLVFREEKALRS